MNTHLVEGLITMLIGMGTVLTFLCLMIVSMYIMSAVVRYLNKIFPEAVVQPAGSKVKSTASDDEAVAVAILASMLKK